MKHWQIKFPTQLNVTTDTIVRMEVGGVHCVVRAVENVRTFEERINVVNKEESGEWWIVEALFGKLPNTTFESQIEDVIHPEKEEEPNGD
jgi:hypothetical protein